MKNMNRLRFAFDGLAFAGEFRWSGTPSFLTAETMGGFCWISPERLGGGVQRLAIGEGTAAVAVMSP